MSNIINSYRFGAAASGFLLDDYSNGAAAYSLRKLKTGVTYACKVRRSSDNATTDVELYDTGSIDLSSTVSAGGNLGTWLSSDDGFIDTWYDQVGSLDAVQATTSLQPRIASSGTLQSINSKTAVRFTTNPDKLVTASALSAIDEGNSFSVFNVSASLTINTGYGTIWSSNSSNSPTDRLVMHRDNRADAINFNVRTTIAAHNATYSTRRNTLNQILTTLITDGTTYDSYDNGTAGSSVTPTGTYTNNAINIGTQLSTLTLLFGYVQEIIFFSADKSSDRTSIESDIDTYYSIP